MKNEAGLSLIELVIALGLLGIIALALLSSMSGASRAYYTADVRSTAESLARSELEYIKQEDYHEYDPSDIWTYELPATPPSWDASHTLPSGYTGYSVNVTPQLPPAYSYDQGIQLVTVTVYRDNDTNPVVILEGYKANR